MIKKLETTYDLGDTFETLDYKQVTSITFDIETGALPRDELIAIFEPKTREEFVGKRNWKAETVDKNYQDYLDTAFDEFSDNAAKSAMTGRVLAIGILAELRDGQEIVLIEGGEDEAKILSNFWSLYANCEKRGIPILGWNSNKFDVPFTIQRSRIRRQAVPSGVIETWKGRASFNPDVFVDIKTHWTFGDPHQQCSCEQVARAMGISGFKEIDGEKYTGADFEKLWFNDREKAVKYLQGDVIVEHRIARILEVI